MTFITLGKAKSYLRVDSADEDALIESLLFSAERLCVDVSRLSDEKWEAMNELRKFMFANVYSNKHVKSAGDPYKVEEIITSLFEYYLNNPGELPSELLAMQDDFTIEELAKDHVASMSDRYAINKYNELFVPAGWK